MVSSLPVLQPAFLATAAPFTYKPLQRLTSWPKALSSCCLARANKVERQQRAARCQALSEPDEYSLRQAAKHAVDTFIPNDSVVGLGQGPMVAYAIEYLSEQLQKGHLKRINCLPGSDMASVEAAVSGIPTLELNGEVEADVTLLEADELDCSGSELALITGRAREDLAQQPQLGRLRQLLDKTKQSLVFAAGRELISQRLSGAIPVLVEGPHWEDIAEELDDIFLPAAEIWRRPTEGTANPRGGANPFTSKEGHHILDIRFNGILKLYGYPASYKEIAAEIATVHGVVAHGLITGMSGRAIIAQPDGPLVIEKAACI